MANKVLSIKMEEADIEKLDLRIVGVVRNKTDGSV